MNFTNTPFDIILAFIAGISAFFASCLLPLVPAYLTYLTGISLTQPTTSASKRQLFKHALFFVIGFIITFIIISLSLKALSLATSNLTMLVSRFVGLLMIILAAVHLNLIHLPAIIDTSGFMNKLRTWQKTPFHSFVVGIGFGCTWTPCIGPILALILFWVSQIQSESYGILLLVIFGLGLGTPFLLVAVAWERLLPYFKHTKKFTKLATLITSILLLTIGVLLVTGTYPHIIGWVTQFLT